MEVEYKQYVDYELPNALKLINKFRELKLPIVWTNWARKRNDGLYGAVDRYYGPRGITSEDPANPCYCFMENGEETVEPLAPKTPEENSCVVQSLHLNKFADLDENGREILFPMLEAWGVNTIILMGAWTDDCIAATVFDAIDRYGYDTVLVEDGMATATPNGCMMLKCLSGACGNTIMTDAILAHLDGHPELTEAPKAPLDGSVRLTECPMVLYRGPKVPPANDAEAVEAAKKGKICASGAHDPGCIDKFGDFAEKVKIVGDEAMPNVEYVPNGPDVPNEGEVKTIYPDHPAVDILMKISPSWKLEDQKRNYALVVEDMEVEYEQYVDYVMPNALKLINKFRELRLPIVWTNWARKRDDGLYGAVDRYYGPRGITSEEPANPCYCFKENGEATVEPLAPKTPEEVSCVVQSLHLNKFADLDENGREILFPMLEAWGVNTIILMGAWTDDCIAATVFDAIDRYGYDTVLVEDGMATATPNGCMMLKCLSGACGNAIMTDAILAHLDGHPELTEAPKAPLKGQVYHTAHPLEGKRRKA